MLSDLLSARKTKIIATLGPSSSSYDMIKRLCFAGVNVFRLNFSHGNAEDHKKIGAMIRDAEQELSKYIGIMADLQGPKIRIGVFEDGQIALKTGSKFILDSEKDFGNTKRVSLPHPEIFNSLREGTVLLLDDGKIKLEVSSNDGVKIETKVIIGGVLSNRKGVNVPNTVLPINALTIKDKKDIEIAEEIGVDWIAVSFVQVAEDISYAKGFINNEIKIISKIEKPSAIENIDKIIDVSDGIMVARGDLGVELPVEMIPSLQRKIVEKCREKKCPVIVATQMLESMRDNCIPTRAEVSDVANAVYQGTDAVMLSAESASGLYPTETVETMNRIIKQAEHDVYSGDVQLMKCQIKVNDLNTAMTDAVCVAVEKNDINIIAAFTESGRTALNVSSGRTSANILALTPNIKTARRISLFRGVTAMVVEDVYTFSQMIQVAQQKSTEIYGNSKSTCNKIAIVAGIPFRESGSTNLLHICDVCTEI